MSIKYIKLPIYSVAIFGQYLYFAGGGGGSTGIPNQIKIFHRVVSDNPAGSIDTGRFIIENLTVSEEHKLLLCNANQFVIVYDVEEGGRVLNERYRFKADFSQKDRNVNAMCLLGSKKVVMTGSEDNVVRFYQIGPNQADLLHQHSQHSRQIKSVDHNQQNLFLSTDNYLIAICNLDNKSIVRTLHQDMFMPEKTLLRSAYFLGAGRQDVIVTHFITRSKTFVTKEEKGKFHTKELLNDQVSATAYHPQHQILGIACAHGSTLMLSSNNLSLQGVQNNLKQGVNACFITRKKYLISGTSSCSYHIQAPQGSLPIPWSLVLTLLLTALFVYLMGSEDLMQL